MTEDQMAIPWGRLAEAVSPEERLPVLAEIIEIAAARPGDAIARLGLDQALIALETLAESADDDGDYLMALYLFAQASLARDTGSDLDDAIGALRELRDVIGANPPEPEPEPETEPKTEPEPEPEPDPEQIAEYAEMMLEIETKLGVALFERASRPGGGLAEVDEAGRALTAALGRMAPDAVDRPALTAALALQRATRYAGHAGTEEDRTSALALAADVLAWPDAADDAIAGCHLVTAWMTLTRRMTEEQRSLVLIRPRVEAVRRGGSDATSIFAALGETAIDPADAETALTHLRQVPGNASADDVASPLSSLAVLALIRAGRVSEDVDRVAEQLRGAAEQARLDKLEAGELLAMRAALLAGRPGPDGLTPSVAALTDAAGRLPEGHLMRTGMFGLLQQSLRQQVDLAESAADVAAEIGRIMDMLEQMPRGDPEFARTLTFAAVYLLATQPAHRAAVPLDRIIAQLDPTLDRFEPDDQMRFLGESMYWGAVATKAGLEHRPDEAQRATAELARCADRAPADSIYRPLALVGAAAGLVDRYVMTGELRLLSQAEDLAVKASKAIDDAEAASPSGDTSAALRALRGRLRYVRGAQRVARFQHEPDNQDLTAILADFEQAADLTGPSDVLRSRMLVDLDAARAVLRIRLPSRGSQPALVPAEREAFARILAEAQRIARDHHDFPALAAQAASGLMMRGVVDSDTAAMGQAVSLMAEACAVPGLTYRERPRMLNTLGVALLTKYTLTRDPRDLSHAIDRLEEARRAVEQELGSPYAADVLQSLAGAYRARGDAARGDVDRAVAVGLGALREHAGDVLLQDDDENALRAARRMTSEAGEMARWFLWHGQPGPAIEALEFGRGTVLHAATAGARLAEVLEDSGHTELAAEWARHMPDEGGATPEAADDLRYRIMMAIEGSPAEVALLAPPSLDEITAALRARAVDALVYLLPRGEARAGLAVLVPANGGVTPLPLPGLRTGPGSPVDSFLRARRAGGQDWRAALGQLCDWAWRTAIGPVLAAMPARGGSRRVVLVPGEELGLVAWHAARQPVEAGYRYAAQEAVFCYASSARQFVEVASSRPDPWPRAPVLISDSTASAYATEMGICQLYASHYPGASVFGCVHDRLTRSGPAKIRGSAAASAADVLAALPHRSHPGASMLHFGCHGEAQVPVLNSELKLGGENRLAVRDILQQARRRSGRLSGGLVVLASCLSDVAEVDYDEALTLATAFISVGASGVVAARWKVEDSDTALFMAAFHHYLNRGDRDPARALRSAQVWMLDPARRPLGPLPQVLGEEVARADLADPVAWAGFAYQGW